MATTTKAVTTQTIDKPEKSDFSDLSDQISTIKTDLAELTTIIGDVATGKASDARSKGADIADAAKTQLADATSRSLVVVEDAYQRSEDAVRRQPMLAVGVAAAIGMFAGYLIAGRGRR